MRMWRGRRLSWRWALGGVAAVIAVALALDVIAAPMLAGLPVGWGIYSDSQYHLQVGGPPLWSFTANRSEDSCSVGVSVVPPFRYTSSDSIRRMDPPEPPYIGVTASLPCAGAAPGSIPNGYVSSGQSASVLGQRITIYRQGARYVATVNAQETYYTFVLDEASQASAQQRQQDYHDFLTVMRSLRYIG
jgi:hypothetical protein